MGDERLGEARTGKFGAALIAASKSAKEESPTPPSLLHVFSANVHVGAPVELGMVDGGRERFIPILGGEVYGPCLSGIILPAGGDWQMIRADGRTELLARYLIKADDETVIAIENPGLRVASPDVIRRIADGEEVSPSLYYSGGSPRFRVAAGTHHWLTTRIFVVKGIRLPDRLKINFFMVE